jgi:hypothetical protein
LLTLAPLFVTPRFGSGLRGVFGIEGEDVGLGASVGGYAMGVITM